MQELFEALETRMQQLQQAMLRARLEHDDAQVASLHEDLERTQAYWASLVLPDSKTAQAPPEPERAAASQPTAAKPSRSAQPFREKVHQALTLLTVPTSPKILSQVHEAFFTEPLNTARLTSLRRDEERSYRATATHRAYYICPALTCDHLAPARALVAVSNWSLERRLVGPLSHRVHFLTAALRIADAARQRAGDVSSRPVQNLLRHYSRNIPGYPPHPRDPVDLDVLRTAARDELAVHATEDADTRAEAAERAREQLSDIAQIFGSTLHDTNRTRRTA